MNLPDRRALVTGASTGIGLELARLLARERYALAIVARRRDALEHVAAELKSSGSPLVHILPADLSDPAAPGRVHQQLQQMDFQLDVLVNNAGFGANGNFAELDLATQMQMIQVNVSALTELTHLFLPGLLARPRGYILNVGSLAGFVPGPRMAIYFATKAFVLSFSEALADELRHSTVSVTALCPGPTRTQFHHRAYAADTHLFRGPVSDAAAVARAGYQGMLAGKTIVIPGVQNKLMAQFTRLVPRALVRKVSRRFNTHVK